MEDIVLRYSLLDNSAKSEISDFIDFLLTKDKKVSKKKLIADYQKKLLKISTWSEKDIEQLKKNGALLNKIKPLSW